MDDTRFRPSFHMMHKHLTQLFGRLLTNAGLLRKRVSYLITVTLVVLGMTIYGNRERKVGVEWLGSAKLHV